MDGFDTGYRLLRQYVSEMRRAFQSIPVDKMEAEVQMEFEQMGQAIDQLEALAGKD